MRLTKLFFSLSLDFRVPLFSLLLATVGLVFISSGRWRGGVGLFLLRQGLLFGLVSQVSQGFALCIVVPLFK